MANPRRERVPEDSRIDRARTHVRSVAQARRRLSGRAQVSSSALGTGVMEPPVNQVPGARRPWHRAEDLAASLTLGAMVLLPLVESTLRRLFQTGISGASLIEQHLGLVLGMIGGAIAAREGRLLALSTLGDTAFRGPVKALVRTLTASVSAAVVVFLAIAGAEFVALERGFAKTLVYGIPIWAIELVFPARFAV